MSESKRRALESKDTFPNKRSKPAKHSTDTKAEEEKKARRVVHPSLLDTSVERQRNVNKVIYGGYEMGAWYYSPFPKELGSVIERLYICDFCLLYMDKEAQLNSHRAQCQRKRPPGRVVYANGKVKVYEIDGHENKFYCQNLCLVAKLFLDNKTLYYDTDGFKFYVLTEQHHKARSKDQMIGYFSKEKVSYDNYNLACIMTLPTHQQKGYGRLLIELSYELSKSEGKIGSPEKPLSPLGNLGYQSYWASTIISLLLHFRGDVTISEICKGTCIHEEDVIGTLSRLGLLRYRKQKSHIQHIFVTQEMIDEALVKFNIKLGRKLDPENIRWK